MLIIIIILVYVREGVMFCLCYGIGLVFWSVCDFILYIWALGIFFYILYVFDERCKGRCDYVVW